MKNHESISFDLLVNIQSYSDDELRAISETLQKQELEISRERRLIHGKLDIIRAEIVRRLREKHEAGESLIDEGDLSRLTSILDSQPQSSEDGTD